MRFIHILAGSFGLLLGYIALFSVKGATLHRRSGRLYVYVMLVMGTFGALLAALSGVWTVINVPAGWSTAYLVMTGTATVHRPAGWSRRLDVGLMVLALAVGLAMLAMGVQAVANGGDRNGIPAFPFFLFGMVGVVGGLGDIRMLRSGPFTGTARLVRHLWRMSFALFIAAMSFFLGQAKVIPEPIRIYPLLAVPVLAVLLTMGWWLWKLKVRKSLKGITERSAGLPFSHALPVRRDLPRSVEQIHGITGQSLRLPGQ